MEWNQSFYSRKAELISYYTSHEMKPEAATCLEPVLQVKARLSCWHSPGFPPCLAQSWPLMSKQLRRGGHHCLGDCSKCPSQVFAERCQTMFFQEKAKRLKRPAAGSSCSQQKCCLTFATIWTELHVMNLVFFYPSGVTKCITRYF